MYMKFIEVLTVSISGRVLALDVVAKWLKERAFTETLTSEDAVGMRRILSLLVERMIEPEEQYRKIMAEKLMDQLGLLHKYVLSRQENSGD